jgi:hypothetical protein
MAGGVSDRGLIMKGQLMRSNGLVMRGLLVAGLWFTGGVWSSSEGSESAREGSITVAEVNAAQQAWCDGLVKIGRVHKEGGDYKAVAEQLITDLYDYDEGKVFFKPTLAFGPNTFRKTKAGALSYFVGGNPDFPEDSGFALKHWVKVGYDNAGEGDNGIQIHGDIAITMGNVHLTNAAGDEVMVDKTFVFRKCKDGKLRLIVHKSALPFDPGK